MSEYKLIPKQYDFSEIESKFTNDLIDECRKQLISDIGLKRENQIIEALKKRGYTFQNKNQLYEFAKRCELRWFREGPDIKELWYENELVCWWSEKTIFEFKNDTYKAEIIVKVG